jgi:hypothetical protein
MAFYYKILPGFSVDLVLVVSELSFCVGMSGNYENVSSRQFYNFPNIINVNICITINSTVSAGSIAV